MFFPTTDGNVVENFILNDIILWFCYTHDVVAKYVIKVLNCNWPHCVLADGTANCIIYLFSYVIVTDVIFTGPDVIKPILFIDFIVALDVIMEPCGFLCETTCMQYNTTHCDW